jgi:phosphatidylserine decarboxylase
MNNYPHPLIAREGWAYLALSVIAAGAVHAYAGFWWALPLWILAAFVLQFFRDPPRVVPGEAGAVLAPADGRIVAV